MTVTVARAAPTRVGRCPFADGDNVIYPVAPFPLGRMPPAAPPLLRNARGSAPRGRVWLPPSQQVTLCARELDFLGGGRAIQPRLHTGPLRRSGAGTAARDGSWGLSPVRPLRVRSQEGLVLPFLCPGSPVPSAGREGAEAGAARSPTSSLRSVWLFAWGWRGRESRVNRAK